MNSLDRLIAQSNRFHPPRLGDPHPDWYKEWYHFCILGPGVHAILNLNLSGDVRPAAIPGAQIARVVLLVYGQQWDGDVDTIPPRDAFLQPTLTDLGFGHNTVRFVDGLFYLSVALQNRPVTLMLQLKPLAMPLLMHSNAVVGEGRINWLVVPRLEATGTITVGQHVHRLNAVSAYHDHNWGRWLWGHDLAWEWGFALPDEADVPWTLVFDRTTNRARNCVLELTLALWKGQALHRVFTQDEVHVRPFGYLSLPRVPKFPRVMTLIAPEDTADIPHRLEITAVANDDVIRAEFTAESVAQVVIPNETDLDVTIINEVVGRLQLEGIVKGEPAAMQGRAIFEFLT